jgi:type IV pilus assembly protein PilB
MLSLKNRLTQILIEDKLLTPEQLKEALDIQKKKGGRLSDIIVELNFITKRDLALVLSQGLNLPIIDLKRIKIDPQVVSIIPESIARHYQIMPISRIGDTLTVAMADPLNVFAIDHIHVLTGYKINPIISQEKDILEEIKDVYPDVINSFVDGILQEFSDSSVEFIEEEREISPSTEELARSSKEAPVIQVTNAILENAVKKNASDVLIEPQQNSFRIRFRLDGVLREQNAPPRSMHALIVSRIKVMSNLDISEHRLPQEGRFKAMIINREVDFRISILPSSCGEKVAVRILDKSQAKLDIERLGFNSHDVKDLQKAAACPHGMILVCGPTGSGKTTTLYSVLKYVDAAEKNLITVEDPIEFQLPGINQVTVNSDIGLTFGASLRSILRQDPDVIMIGEIRDLETVDIAIKAALTGHLVLSTLHTTTAPGAVARLLNMGVEPYLISASLICVLSQRLIRKICPHCKEAYNLDPEIMEKFNLKAKGGKVIKFYRGKGCKLCLNTGYSGRLAIAEVLLVSQSIRELIINQAQEHIVKQKACAEGMKTLRENGISLALEGVTTLEEILKVTAAD